jgi:cell division protein FtsI/penicillin-binding protein 2
LWRIDGEIFYDWTVHHQVENSQEALVVSCNIAFAKMGISAGYNALSEIFNRFYFNKEAKGFADLFLTFNTGTYKTDISSSASYRIANLSEGLNEISITTFQSALISAVISQNGSIYSPHLIKNKKNLLNIAFYNHTGQLIEVLKAGTLFLKLRNAMRLVVEAPNGTGKRARVDFVKVALKTGTAGNKKLGLDAILTGFFPADKPQYAFAFRLERAGKAEWRGALFLKDFLTAFYHDNPRQQGVK